MVRDRHVAAEKADALTPQPAALYSVFLVIPQDTVPCGSDLVPTCKHLGFVRKQLGCPAARIAPFVIPASCEQAVNGRDAKLAVTPAYGPVRSSKRITRLVHTPRLVPARGRSLVPRPARIITHAAPRSVEGFRARRGSIPDDSGSVFGRVAATQHPRQHPAPR